MEGRHWHTGGEAVAFAGLSALLVFNLIRLASARALASNISWLQTAGRIGGSLIKF